MDNKLSVESFADLFDPRLSVNCRCSGGGGFLCNSEERPDDPYEAFRYAFAGMAQLRNIGMRPEVAHPYGTKEIEMQVKFNVETLIALASVNVAALGFVNHAVPGAHVPDGLCVAAKKRTIKQT